MHTAGNFGGELNLAVRWNQNPLINNSEMYIWDETAKFVITCVYVTVKLYDYVNATYISIPQALDYL